MHDDAPQESTTAAVPSAAPEPPAPPPAGASGPPPAAAAAPAGLPLRGHLALATGAGVVLGVAASVAAGPASTAWLAAACWAVVALPLAPLQWAAARLLRAGRPVAAAGAALRTALATLRGRGGERAPGLAAVAGLVVAPALAATAVLAVRTVHGRLESVTEAGVAEGVLAAAVAGALAVVALAWGPLTAGLGATLRALDRLVRLPLPARPEPYAAVLFAAPLAAGTLLVLDPIRPHVGALAAALDLVVLLTVEVALLPLAAFALRRLRPGALRLGLAGLALAAVAGVALAPAPLATELVAAEQPGAGAATIVRLLSDVDRDGSAAVLGGGDCAPFDSAVHPGAPDAAGDGLDPDCDGIDPTPQPPSAVVSNALPPDRVQRYDVVLVLIDALRADQLGSKRGDREVLPFLDALAAESLVFTNALSTSSTTRVAMATLFTGTWPSRTAWKGGTTDLSNDALTLAERLRAAGWQTWGRINRWVAGQMKGVGQGFEEIVANLTLEEQKDHHDQAGGVLTHRVIKRLQERDPQKPLFLFLYFEDPHHPYTARKKPERSFGDGSKDRYAADLAYVDRQLGVLLEHLRWSGRWDRTVVIVLADHGEEFKEHGGDRHARTLFDEVLRVPIVVRVPGLPPQTIDAPVSLVDVVPTVLELVGLPVDAATVDGRSLFLPALAGARAPDRPLVAELRGQPRAHHLRALRRGRWKLIQDLTTSTVALYDLEADAGEKKDVAAENPAIRDELLKELAAASAAR